MKRLPKNKKLINIARTLRKNQTKEEKHLWYDFLSNYDIKFRRQQVIGSYVADFYCDKIKLVVELDGFGHSLKKQEEKDRLRTEYFNSLGIYVLRFDNYEINNNFNGVCETIDREVKRIINTL